MDLEIENVGPITALNIPLEPGIVVLKGTNGSGKSTALRAVDRLLGGKAVDLSVTDGEKRGRLELGSATLTITKSQTRTGGGELEVVGLVSRLDIAALVDPGILDAEKADNARQKALVALMGVEGRPDMFYDLVGGQSEYEALGVTSSEDVLVLAQRVKAKIEANARANESAAEKARANVEAVRAQSEGTDLKAECDEEKLASVLAAATSKYDEAKKHNETARTAKEAAAKAAHTLEELGEASEKHADLLWEADETAKEADRAADECDKHMQRALALDAQATAARETANRYSEQYTALNAQVEELKKRADKAKYGAETRAKLKAEAEAAVPKPHDSVVLNRLEDERIGAREAVSKGVVIRLAKQRIEAAEAEALKGREIAKRAQRLRDMAAGVDVILTKLLADDCPFRIEAGRLVVATDRSESELYSDLSMGERCRLAIEFAAKRLPPGKGLLTMPQEFFESLDPANRLLVSDLAKELRITILAAEASDGPLRAEAFEG